jgi:DNA-binding HxlR family transcriptional regulator
MKRKFPKVFCCPTELTLDVLGGKWKTVILSFLKQRPCRYAELSKLMPTLSDKMLTERLGDLVDAGLIVKRKASASGKREVYALTDRAHSLDSILQDLHVWGSTHTAEFGAKIEDPLRDLQPKKACRQFGKDN